MEYEASKFWEVKPRVLESKADGLAICKAMCERLMDLKVYTFFATHFFEICWMSAKLQGFRSMHLQRLEGGGGKGTRSPRFFVQRVTSMKAGG